MTRIPAHLAETRFIHTVEPADWLTGGPMPEGLAGVVEDVA
ncbi:hypothetical protein P7L74_09670 [Tistrella mobilis]